MTTAYNLCNLFRKDTAANVAVYPKIHKVEINHILNYKEDGEILSFKDYKNIESTDIELFNKQKEEIVNFFKQINKSIYESLNDNSLNYINVGDTIIIKKSDFVSATLEIRHK